jgi:hypothetical protein
VQKLLLGLLALALVAIVPVGGAYSSTVARAHWDAKCVGAYTVDLLIVTPNVLIGKSQVRQFVRGFGKKLGVRCNEPTSHRDKAHVDIAKARWESVYTDGWYVYVRVR